MKKVMDSDMVAHVWAAQSQDEARNPQRNFYFNGATIYSYGSHFPIARIVTQGKKRAVLFTTRTYGPTTSKHLWATRRALNGLDLPTFNVNDPSALTHPKAKEEYAERVADELEKAVKARLYKERHLNSARDLAAEANAFSAFFKLRWRLPIPEIGAEAIEKAKEALAKHTARLERENAARIAAQKKAREKRLKEEAEQQAAWLRGEAVAYPYSYSCHETLLRVFGDEVQTSRGADIPVEHAKRVWPVILRHKRNGTVFQSNGHKLPVGHFTIDRIEPTGDIKAGCHTIRFPEIEKIACQLGLN